MILRFFDSFNGAKVKACSKLWVLGLVALTSPVHAAERSLFATEPAVNNEEKPFSGVASLSLRSSTASTSEYDYRIFVSPGINLEYAFKDLVTVGLSMRGNKDLNNEMRSSLTDLSFSASRSFELSEGFGLGLDVFYGAPVSKDLIKYSNSKGTLGASAGLSYSFGGALAGLAINGGLSYERYLYEYDYANGGAILTKFSVNQSYGLSYTWRQFTVSGSFTDITSWDFSGAREDDSFLAVETVQYHIDDVWSLQAGHINDGNTFDYLGAANNVKLYDKRRSQVFVGTSYKF